MFRKPNLALHIITMNRRSLLDSLIRECDDYFDAIRVCDGGSKDGTQGMCGKYGVELHIREWDDKYHEQDNMLLSRAKPKDWVMIMDDDECPSRPLLDNLRRLIASAKKQGCNMISIPSLLVLDDEPECGLSKFIEETKAGSQRFRKYWLFEYDKTVKSYGTPHRSVESMKGWKTFDQPYPYYHFKTSWSFVINDCIHAWIDPFNQGYTRTQADEMYSVLPTFHTSREVEGWLKDGDVSDAFISFAQKYKASDKPIRNWWEAYQCLRESP